MAKGCRVTGPYAEGKGFRVVAFLPERRSFYCATREEAVDVRTALQRRLSTLPTRTIGEALAEYLAAQAQAGHKPVSLRTVRSKLAHFLPLDEPLHLFGPEQAAARYQAETRRIGRFGRPLSAAMHRATLKTGRAFFRWAVERRYVERNPFDGVKPVGRPNSGKPQLRLDEARQLLDHLLAKAESGEAWALALATQLVLGLRSSEVLGRRVRDLDDDARLFCIEAGKTANARRWLELDCEPLRRLLARHAAGRPAGELLFGGGRETPHRHHYLWRRLRQTCQELGLPAVCPHSLRGLHSTIAVERGATSGVVAAALGHGSFAVTARHYVEPTALAASRQRKVSAALSASRPTAPIAPAGEAAGQALALLRTLPPDELSAVLRALGRNATGS